jgi:hypothetical protein
MPASNTPAKRGRPPRPKEVEEWRDIDGYEGLYQISNFGKVKSVKRECVCPSALGGKGKRTVPERIRKPNIMKGYHCISLIKEGKHKVFRIHSLVAEHFISVQPTPDYQINHIDGDKANNHVENLEWVLPIENTRHAIENGLRQNPSSETKKKISAASKRHWLNETYRQKQTERMLQNWASPAYRKRVLKNMCGKTRTEEQRRRYAAVAKETKPVINMDTGEVFASRRIAAEKYNRTPEAIGMAINGGCKTCAGYKWRYV